MLNSQIKINNMGLKSEEEQKKFVGAAVRAAIMEILPPVVDRSVTIVLITTRALVLKDFALDSSTEKVIKAAEFTVQSLAGSLALVTCREPLRMSLSTIITKRLKEEGSNFPDEMISEFANLASKENLELGCDLIKKAVVQKALTKVRKDQAIIDATEKRRDYRGPQDGFQDDSQNRILDLPEKLKPLPTGLTEDQFQVYQPNSDQQEPAQNYSEAFMQPV